MNKSPVGGIKSNTQSVNNTYLNQQDLKKVTNPFGSYGGGT